jgi:hypothetical protein
MLAPDGGDFPLSFYPLDVAVSVEAPATHFRYTINDENIDVNTGTLVNAISGTVTVNALETLRVIAITATNIGSPIKEAFYGHGTPSGGGGPPIPR